MRRRNRSNMNSKSSNVGMIAGEKMAEMLVLQYLQIRCSTN
jgi:hypothetical protein